LADRLLYILKPRVGYAFLILPVIVAFKHIGGLVSLLGTGIVFSDILEMLLGFSFVF